MENAINQTTLALLETMREMTIKQVNKRVAVVDQFDHRMLTYLLIETRRAAYIETNTPHTLIGVLHEFNVQKCDTYYEWRFKWYKFLPSNVKNLIK